MRTTGIRRGSTTILRTLILIAAGTMPVAAGDIPRATAMLGFSSTAAERERSAENDALTVPAPENARRSLRILTAEPHVAGSPADHDTAIFVRDKLAEWGWKAEIVEFKVLLNYPRTNGGEPHLVLFDNDRAPEAEGFSMKEPVLAADNDSGSAQAFPGFHGYGASGSARGRVVYANYGRPEDFAALEKLGVSLKGKIVLVRYGAIFRGLKVQYAQKRGAAGVLIYSDPADDGFAKGEVYPAGPYRPGGSLQRGSVQFLSMGPGDPSTPLGSSLAGGERIPFDRDKGLLYDEKWARRTGIARDDYVALIPSLPVGYDTAQKILAKLAGPVVPTGWQGGLPLTYHVGAGPATIDMGVAMDYALRPIWNVIATIPGTVEPERWVMLGNHRDAWVHGAVDPGSGTAATLEACRAIGEAAKKGWKPRRTLVYASWDAEEYGLVGSTEWAEAHAHELDQKATLMLNVDSAVSGPEFDASGVPSLRDLMLDAAGAIVDPRTGKTLADGWMSKRRERFAAEAPLVLADTFWKEAGLKPSFTPQMGWMGSGSDYTVFLDHLGVPCLHMGFHGAYGVYHSTYDDFHWMERHGDPGFHTHALAGRLYAVLMMRAAAAPVLPMTFTPYALALKQHVDELRMLEARNRRKKADTAEHGGAFAGLDDLAGVISAFSVQARALDTALAAAASRDDHAPQTLLALNDALSRVERAFLLEPGLAGRPWFRHSIYAPGLTTGYGSWPLPAIRQTFEDHADARVAAESARTADRIKAATRAMGLALERTRALDAR